MTDVYEKLNAERAIRVWALESAMNHCFINYGMQSKAVLERAAVFESYVLDGAKPEPAPEVDAEFEEVEGE